MYTIDLSIRNTAFPVSIQRKTAEDAEAIYKQILDAMASGKPDILELTSEGKVEKKVAIRSTEISGVQMSQKEGGTGAAGRTPGFFAIPAAAEVE
jgi:hypothetical protein